MPQKIDKLVISDTSCLIGLTNIGLLDIMRQLYDTIIITPEVANEYGELLPSWISVKAVSDPAKTELIKTFIDNGEASAIALALELGNALVIIDDGKARRFARGLNLEITGTLGLLIRAYKKGLLKDIDGAVAGLRNIDFYLPANTEYLVKCAKTGSVSDL